MSYYRESRLLGIGPARRVEVPEDGKPVYGRSTFFRGPRSRTVFMQDGILKYTDWGFAGGLAGVGFVNKAKVNSDGTIDGGMWRGLRHSRFFKNLNRILR